MEKLKRKGGTSWRITETYWQQLSFFFLILNLNFFTLYFPLAFENPQFPLEKKKKPKVPLPFIFVLLQNYLARFTSSFCFSRFPHSSSCLLYFCPRFQIEILFLPLLLPFLVKIKLLLLEPIRLFNKNYCGCRCCHCGCHLG